VKRLRRHSNEEIKPRRDEENEESNGKDLRALRFLVVFIHSLFIVQIGFASVSDSLFKAAQTQEPPPAPEQPIPFSHKQHAGALQLKCATCHKNPDPGERMGFPAPVVCMQCHSEIKTESPSIQTLAAAAKEKRELKWARIYEIPTFVFFSHRAHTAAGASCVDCHGEVKNHERLFREKDVSMASCMNCHQAKGASVDCMYCHDKVN
jgi:hypothetical protein